MQQEKLTQLKNIIDKRFEQFKFLISAYNANNRERTDSMIKLQPATLKTMDEIRSSIFIIEREEKRQLAAQNEKLQRTFKTINTITIISLTLAFSLLLFGFITYMQVSKERRKGQQDITNYQNELKNRIDDLNKANEELIKMQGLEKFAVTGRIARTIGHEVRNPLTNIMLASSQLKSAMAEKEENTEYLFEMISRNSDRINQLVSDLLNSTKFSELIYEKTSINSLLNEAMREAEDRITLSNVKVVKKYSSDICDVTVDKEKIKIAFLNIIINALEAMENKEGSVLTLETKGGDKCTVIISDNGAGMDGESVNRLFEPYFTSKPNGNGLGLTNTQNIILAHKGDISVESTPGQGTSFIINLDLI